MVNHLDEPHVHGFDLVVFAGFTATTEVQTPQAR
jgi:hypothetical protein